jgi:Rod binding domain-containing protein
MRLKDTARQFESMFMTEMLRHTRPPNQAAGPFAAGKAEETWRVMMDQALGQAATNNPAADRGGLRRAIEKSLRDADAHSTKGLLK